MCNLYPIDRGQQAIRDLAKAIRDTTGNLPSLPGVFPDYMAPIVRNAPDGVRELCMARWGMPSSQFAIMEKTKKRAVKMEAKGTRIDFKELLRLEPDIGTTNIRNVQSAHWKRWLGVENRCVVPFTSFSENELQPDGSRPPVWFALNESRPLAFFAGVWTRWISVRKMREGETTNDLFAFLTTEPNAIVAPIHPKAMPVILTKPEDLEAWLTAPAAEALALQRPLPDNALRIVARGQKTDTVAIHDEAAIGDNPEARGDPYIGSPQ